MNRRGLLKALCALPAIACAAVLPSATRQLIGSVNRDRWTADGYRKRGSRVLLNGEDITDRCFWFNDRKGVARCYRLDEQGRFYLDIRRKPASEYLYGDIRVVEPKQV